MIMRGKGIRKSKKKDAFMITQADDGFIKPPN